MLSNRSRSSCTNRTTKIKEKIHCYNINTNTTQYLTYKLVTGDGPGTITFRPYAHPITSGSNSGKQIYEADILPGSRYVLDVYYQGQDEQYQDEYGYLFPYKSQVTKIETQKIELPQRQRIQVDLVNILHSRYILMDQSALTYPMLVEEMIDLILILPTLLNMAMN